jgi:hypothetical protein
MTAPKQLLLLFNTAKIEPKKFGLKFCLFKLEERATGQIIGYDYGFANWTGFWEDPMGAENVRVTVYSWCDLPAPKLLF